MKKAFFLFSLFFLMICLNACKDEGGGTPSIDCGGDFDQSAMFQNITDNIILPEYTNFKTMVDDMAVKTETFTTDYSLISLEDLRSSFLAAYTSWQHVAQYSFGPAEEVFLRSSVNNFPLDLTLLEGNILTNTYDFDMPDNYDKGFPAIDYMLYGMEETDEALINRFLNEDASDETGYLNALVTDIQERVNHTYNGWTNGYDETFINNTGTAAGTSLSLIVNGLNQNYELTKREKLGVPSGVLTLNNAKPWLVEAFYSGHSQVLLEASLQASRQLYLGGNGLGLDDYLIHAKAEKNGEPLDNLIKQQFTVAIQATDILASPLSTFIESNQPDVINAYNEVTKQVVNIKTDLPSVLCIAITYIDNPSDTD